MRKVFVVPSLIAGVIVAMFHSVAMATGDIADLFAVADVTGLDGQVKTILLGLAGISLLFLGWKYYKHTCRVG